MEENELRVSFDQKAFNKQKQLWQSSDQKNYKFRLKGTGNNGSDIEIIVENKENKSDITIDIIYDKIEKLYNAYHKSLCSISDTYLWGISVKYDEINHIPTEVELNYDNVGISNPANIYFDPGFFNKIHFKTEDENHIAGGTYTFLICDFEKSG